MAARFMAMRPRAADRAAWDALFVALSIAHAAALVVVPSVPLVAVGLWWSANTIAHNFIHRPFFRSRGWNRAFSIWLGAVLGVPQSLWRARHLRHHRDSSLAGPDLGSPSTPHVPKAAVREAGLQPGPIQICAEVLVIAVVWTIWAVAGPSTFFGIVLPGYAIGLVLCLLQGHFEHAGGTTSHYGWLYNFLFFNDGYHVEHHRRPGAPWTELRRLRDPDARASRWPPVLRWLDAVTLDALEHVVVHSPALQRFVVDRHERAWRRMLPGVSPARSVVIVGGGLFPRTAIVLRRLLPDADVTVVDANPAHLELARRYVDPRVTFVCATFAAGDTWRADVLVVPLAYRGDRHAIYADPPAPTVFVHDWIWSRTHRGTSISWLLCKRLNCVSRPASATS